MPVKRKADLPNPKEEKGNMEFVEFGIFDSDSPAGFYFSDGVRWVWMGSRTDLKSTDETRLQKIEKIITKPQKPGRGILTGTTLPSTGKEGDFFHHEIENILYEWHHICWSPVLDLPGLLQNTTATDTESGFILNTNGCGILNTVAGL